MNDSNDPSSASTAEAVPLAELVEPPSPSTFVSHGIALVALTYALFAGAASLAMVLDVLGQPIGSGIRPMGWPIAILFYGLGSPLLSGCSAVVVFRSTRQAPQRFRDRALPRWVAISAWFLGVATLFLTTGGMCWAIQARQLWFKP